MEYTTSLIRLPQWATTEIEKYAQEKGLRFATAVRCIVVERLREIAPVTACKQETGAASPQL
ncbi:MAG: hypothetical protein OIN87_09150 [Candidatus Methanoperedens sp.]|nr:hypothetical protein [Candidatus Methanoperedens sp.]